MFVKIKDVSIKSILGVVPKSKYLPVKKSEQTERVIKVLGVQSSYKTNKATTTSDLFCSAANMILKKNKLKKSKIDILVCVTQTPDYLMPSCSNIVLQQIKLSEKCIAYDINLGCSGYVYGLWNIMSAIQNSNMKYGLLLTGDTISKTINKSDDSNNLLFGDGVSATLIEKNKNDVNYFQIGSALEGHNKLMIYNSGFKNTSKKNKHSFYMDGKEVFSFALTKVPVMIKTLLNSSKISIDKIKYFVFHQANKMMLNKIFESLNISLKKRLFSIKKYGNTSSASIPITISSSLSGEKINQSVILAGFGAGFSFAACIIKLNKAKIFKVFKYEK